MSIQVRTLELHDYKAWDDYVNRHPNGTLYHLSNWRAILKKTYGLKSCYLMALHRDSGAIAGVLPLVFLRQLNLSRSLISMPYADLGGVLADDGDSEGVLLQAAVELARRHGVRELELRHLHALKQLTSNEYRGGGWQTRSHKVRMMFAIQADSSETLLASFKAKLRSQIKRPLKAGLRAAVGGSELLNDFYQVFCINMRDLGSPVHAKSLIRNVLTAFQNTARIVAVYQDQTPLAASVVVGYKDILENPWASSLRAYSRLSPNMLLYWTMLSHACDSGYGWFDFGRSSPEEGTYRFKKQWGAQPWPLHWHYLSLRPAATDSVHDGLDKNRFQRVIHYWQKLPVGLSKLLGPLVRKHIGL